VREAIKLLFGLVSGFDPGIVVLDAGHIPEGKGEVFGFSGSLVLKAY